MDADEGLPNNLLNLGNCADSRAQRWQFAHLWFSVRKRNSTSLGYVQRRKAPAAEGKERFIVKPLLRSESGVSHLGATTNSPGGILRSVCAFPCPPKTLTSVTRPPACFYSNKFSNAFEINSTRK